MCYNLPKLEDDKKFENLCCDIMKTKSPNGFIIFGSNGQKQNGIDVFPIGSETIYVQCKNYLGMDKKTKESFITSISKDYTDAISNFTDCSQFWVFTALRNDNYIIKRIKEISKPNKPIVLFFWQDITKEIIANPDLLKIYYPFYFNQDNFKFIIGEEKKLIIDIQGIIKKNSGIIVNIDLFTKKSSDFIELENLYELLYDRVKLYLRKVSEYKIRITESMKFISNFIGILSALLDIMAINSYPNDNDTAIRCTYDNIRQETIKEFYELKENAMNHAFFILNLPTNDN